MEEIPNNHLGCIKPSKYGNLPYPLVSRISSINSITRNCRVLRTRSLGHQDFYPVFHAPWRIAFQSELSELAKMPPGWWREWVCGQRRKERIPSQSLRASFFFWKDTGTPNRKSDHRNQSSFFRGFRWAQLRGCFLVEIMWPFVLAVHRWHSKIAGRGDLTATGRTETSRNRTFWL